MNGETTRKRLLISTVALAVSAAMLTSVIPGAMADPDADDQKIEQLHQQTNQQKQQIGQIEAELANVRAKQNEAQLNAELAAEEYNLARDELSSAQTAMEQAQQAEISANEERDRARTEIAKLIMAVYRDRSLSLAALQPYLEADGLHNMEMRRRAVAQFGAEADRKIQHYDATEAVAKVIHGEAQKNVKKHEEALEKVESQRKRAAQIAAAADAEVAKLENQRQEQIAALAHLREVTVEQERQRQERMEAEANARAEAAARRKVEEELAKARAAAEKKAQQEAAAAAARQREAEAAREREAARKVAEQKEREEAARKQAAKDKAERDKAARNQAAREQAARDKAAREQAAREQADREQAARDKAAKDKAARAKAAREKAARAKAERAKAATNANKPVSAKAASAVEWAKQNLGIPYVWGGASSSGYDCSGFTQGAWGSQGVYLPHSSRMQYHRGTRVPLDKAQPGDLLFWSRNGSPSSIHHVALYVGPGQMIEAPRAGLSTKFSPIRYRHIMPYVVRLP